MRLVTFRDAKGTRVGAMDAAGQLLDITAVDAGLPHDMIGLIAAGALAAALAAAAKAPVVEGGKLLAPIPR
ncbi:MAG: hypothetical protein K2X46_21020, partial [Roseomonas sp.]|nr:hypothetical protein [Roseomonas sp.]